MIQTRNCRILLLAALLIGAAGTAFAGTPCGTHLNLFLQGGNQLYWPSDGENANAKMLGFRAWFRTTAMKTYSSPITAVCAVSIFTNLLSTSGGKTPVVGGDNQIYAW